MPFEHVCVCWKFIAYNWIYKLKNCEVYSMLETFVQFSKIICHRSTEAIDKRAKLRRKVRVSNQKCENHGMKTKKKKKSLKRKGKILSVGAER